MMLKILMAHNYYRQAGGEDESFRAEAELLESHGCLVSRYTRDNDEIREMSMLGRVGLAQRTIWAKDSYRSIRGLIKKERPGIVHFQNTFPLISPAAYEACRAEGVPVVQSLRNYRLICPNALFFRDNHPCEDCLPRRIPWPGVAHACYRNSRTQSAVVAGMIGFHRWKGTWKSRVDLFIALSEFSKQKFIEGGVPPGKIGIKPNFVVDRGVESEREDYGVFLGRLSNEKGLSTLLNAWRTLSNVPLLIVGAGPLYKDLQASIDREGLTQVKMLGYLPNVKALELLRRARFLIFPTEWYETFGRVVVEAYSAGVPVIASRIGAVTELIRDRETGLLFNPGDPDDLASKVRQLWDEPGEMARMGRNARQLYEEKYTPEANYRLLMDLYARVMAIHQ